MAVCGRNSYGRPIFETTILVPTHGSSTHHTHFSLGERVEGGVRDIVTETHPLSWCYNPARFSNWCRLNRDEIASLVFMGFPIDQVSDWTEEEAELISSGLCPETPVLYQQRQEFEAEMQQRITEYRRISSSSWEMMEEEETVHEPEPTEPQEEEEFPLGVRGRRQVSCVRGRRVHRGNIPLASSVWTHPLQRVPEGCGWEVSKVS